MKDPMIMLGYVLGAAMVCIGIAILAGLLALRGDVDPMLNIVFGGVVTLFGLYRVVVTHAKRKQKERQARAAAEAR